MKQIKALKLAEETLLNMGAADKQIETPGRRDRERVAYADRPTRQH